MTTIDDLIAAEDIRMVKARYFRAMDTQDWDLLMEVFTDDATCDYRGALVDPPGSGNRRPTTSSPDAMQSLRTSAMDYRRWSRHTMVLCRKYRLPA